MEQCAVIRAESSLIFAINFLELIAEHPRTQHSCLAKMNRRKNRLMSACHLEVFIDHKSNLSLTMNLSSNWASLLHQIDSCPVVGVLNDPFQGGSKLRIQASHSQLGSWCFPVDCDESIVHRIDHIHLFDPMHCFPWKTRTRTYLGFF